MALQVLFSSPLELFLLLCLGYGVGKVVDGTNEKGVLKCVTLKNDCINDIDCYANALNVHWFCQGIFNGKGKKCSQMCREELGNFTLNDNIGRALAKCSCGDDALCLTYRARGLKCLNRGSTRNITGCSSMLQRCKNDKACLGLWELYLLRCTHLISGTECTDKCLSIQEDLFKYPLMRNYQKCECDGDIEQETFCRGVRVHYSKLCIPRINNMINQLPNTVDDGTNLDGLEKESRNFNHGPTIRSHVMILYLTLATLISITIQLI